MIINRKFISRAAALVSTLAVVAGIALPVAAYAATQVTSRSIQISDSRVSATGTSYLVKFTAQSAGAQSLVIDFCQDSPIIGASCATTNGVSFTSATISGSTLPAGWTTVATSGSNFKLTGGTAALASGTTYQFTINGVNNPSGTSASAGTAGSYYARIYTYTSNSASGYSAPNSLGTYNDYGGFALSTTSPISITAIVQETLTFCVSATAITGTCSGGLTTPALTIGTGSPAVLTTAGAATPAYTQLSTNANGGTVVAMKATNLCTNGGLSTTAPDTSGGCASIVGNGTGNAVMSGGKFGMCIAPGTGITAANTYKDTSANGCPTTFNATTTYGMNGTNTTSTYGDTIYSATAPVNAISSSLTFAAMSANTTPAGVYTGNEILIATGTF